MKDTLIDIKDNLQGNNSTVDEAKNQINDLEHEEAKNNQSEQEEKRIKKNKKDSINGLWDNFKQSNILLIGVPEREVKEQEIGNLFEEIMKGNFPNLVKEIDMQVQEAQRVPNKMDAYMLTPRHIIITMPKVKDKERILKAPREKQLVTFRGVPIRLSADFSKETLQTIREWQEIFKVKKSRDLQPKSLYPTKISFRIEGQIKSFQDKKKTKGVHHHQTIIT